MMTRIHNASPYGTNSRGPRSAFTLVEMLVSVALVVIMMAMFASVFQLAAGSVGTQRGIAENDQRARSATIIIRNDLESRSSVLVVPFNANEPQPNPGEADYGIRRFDQRAGYFYISENDINDDTDDVLQFTTQLPGTTGDFFVSRAANLSGLSTTTTFLNSNEPDRDDGNPGADASSDSVAAEISYFLRGGRLYRRVMLIRDPLVPIAGNTQPQDTNGNNYFDPNNDGTGMPALPRKYQFDAAAGLSGNFWGEFDFSAHFGVDGAGTSTGAVFHGIDYLDNTSNNTNTAQVGSGLVPAVLGDPRFRFGHNQVDGLPREFVRTSGGTTNNQFIGRFTHEETSFEFFQFPHTNSLDSGGTPINGGNPMDQNAGSRQLSLVGGIVSDTTEGQFLGARRAEDLLLANVHSFDVKVWDETVDEDPTDGTLNPGFFDVGHDERDTSNNPTGDYNQANNTVNPTYGPNGINSLGAAIGNRVFDTWRPDLDIDNNGSGDGTNDPPPFRPVDGSGNPTRLRAIQITIRYLDVSSNQLRQVTLQISLMNDA